MKYFIIAFAAIIVSVTELKAQSFDMGLKAGLNFSSLDHKLDSQYSGTASANGFVGGAWARVGFLGFFAQPELLYSQRKGAFTSTLDGTAVINTLSYIDVPVMLGYKIAFVRFNVGPNFQFLLDADQKASDLAKDPNFSKDNFESSSIGFQAGAGIDLLKLSIDLRYDGNFSSIGKEITVNGTKYDYSTRPSMWQLTLGFKIF
ncbi:MAG: porin family protein [Bacteroidota bacterium]